MKMKKFGQVISKSIFRQYDIGVWWGGVKNVAGSVVAYVTFLNLIFVAPLAFKMVVYPWLSERGIELPFFVFMGVLFLGIAVIFMVEFKITLPSFYRFWNEQWWEHNNPMRRKMDAMDKRMDKRLKAIEEALGIKEHEL